MMATQHLVIESATPYRLGKSHTPYMVLPKGGTGPFSCAHCDALYVEDGQARCGRQEFVDFNHGSPVLPDEKGDPLDDPSRACSDWFSPRGA